MEVFGLEINSLDDLIESDYESEADDMDNDKTFEPTEKELKDMERQDASDDDEMMTQGSVKDRKRKAKSSDGKDAKVKKKEREFELKSKIAQEVAKYPHIYDIRHKSFADKQLQASTWKKIAAAVDLEINQSVKFWESLKRSAKYYANEQKVPCKSGASTNEMSEQTYREEWPHREVMAFYTPPSLRDETAHIVLSNRRSNTPAKSINSDFDPALEDELRDAMSHCDTDSCYDFPSTSTSKPRSKKDPLAESVSMMANSISSFVQCKAIPPPQQTENPAKPTLKHMEMWANFDKLVSKLDDDAVDDLNVDIMSLIGAAIKKKRDTS